MATNPHTSLINTLRFKKKKASNLAQGMSKATMVVIF
jgi:hypothetical protein